MYNLQHTSLYQDLEKPMSRPGCWAYPDSECNNGSHISRFMTFHLSNQQQQPTVR
eukprot:COSAG02_NODE_13264_length_1418_cov_1.206217_3_plen_54_part_01